MSKQLKNGQLIFGIVIILISTNTIKSQQYLSKIEYPCWRRCDTHFTGPECWEKTFNYFTNHLFQSLVEYSNVLHKTSNSTQPILNDVLEKTYQNYKKDTDGINNLISKVIENFDKVFYETIKQLPKESSKVLNDDDEKIKCPEKCDKRSLTVWISLFGVLIGLTVASILFIIAYVLFSKMQYKKLDKRLKVNAPSAN